VHVLIARRDYSDYKWGVWFREAPGLPWSPHSLGGRLEPEVDAAVALAFKTKPPMSLTFDTRAIEVASTDVAETPDDLGEIAVNVDATILCREGRLPGPDDRWAEVHRNANHIELWSGLDWVFQPRGLQEKIKGWFEANYWESFGPPTRHKPHSQPLPYERMLIVRPNDFWQARQLAARSFPAFNPGPVLSEAAQAKRLTKLPQSKSALRRQKHAEAHIRIRAEAAARAALREQGTEGEVAR